MPEVWNIRESILVKQSDWMYKQTEEKEQISLLENSFQFFTLKEVNHNSLPYKHDFCIASSFQRVKNGKGVEVKE